MTDATAAALAAARAATRRFNEVMGITQPAPVRSDRGWPDPSDTSPRAAYLRTRMAEVDASRPTPPARVFRKPGGAVAGYLHVRRDRRF